MANGSTTNSLRPLSSCVGIDLDTESVERLVSGHKRTNVRTGDVEKLEDLAPAKFDVVVAGEIVEHLNNPGLFLSSVSGVLDPDGLLIITTTNAYCLRRFLRVPFGYESIHPDHTYYFSHTTLRRLVEPFGFKLQAAPTRISLPDKRPILPYLVERIAALISPNLGEGIIHTYIVDDSHRAGVGMSQPVSRGTALPQIMRPD